MSVIRVNLKSICDVQEFFLLLSSIVCLLVFATPTLALDAEREQILLDLIRASDCSLTGEEAGKILPEHGFTPAETREIETAWAKRGWIDKSKMMTITLTQKACKS